MKRVYWSARKVSRPLILLLTVVALGAVAVVETWPRRETGDLAETKLAAAQLAERAMDELKAERLRRGIPIDPELDPAETGMIGAVETPTTSVMGHLGAKQSTVNPNWAAVLVEMFHEAGVQPGDRIAIGWSGSFPALNLCTLAAVEAIGAEPVAIASVGSSQYGANYPEWPWIEMERHLFEQGVTQHRSVAVSRGGFEDRALHMSDEGRALIDEAIARSGLPKVESTNFDDSLGERMAIYDQHSEGEPFAAYVNVGGGTVSVGHGVGKRLYAPGLNLQPPPAATNIDSILTRFATRGVPLVHLSSVRDLAISYGLPTEPNPRPIAGTGSAFEAAPNRAVSIVALAIVVGLMLLITLRRNRQEPPQESEPPKTFPVHPEPTSRAA